MKNLKELQVFMDHAVSEVQALKRIGTEEELERELEIVRGLRFKTYKKFREARIEEEEIEIVLELKRLEEKLERNLREIENQLEREIEILREIKKENRRKKIREYIIEKEIEELEELEKLEALKLDGIKEIEIEEEIEKLIEKKEIELEELGEYENQLEAILVFKQSGEFIQYHPEKGLAIIGDIRATAFHLHTGAGIGIRVRALRELEELEEDLERKGVRIYRV